MPGKVLATLTVVVAVALSAVSGAAPAPAEPAPTVLTLAPAFFPMPPNLLRGEVFAGNTVVVPYVNIPAAPNVNSGADHAGQHAAHTQVGNWTYMTAWTFPVPAAAQDGDDATLRRQIESGYQRGYVMP